MIEQTQAVTAQYKAMAEAGEALQKSSADPDVKKQVEALQKDFKATVDNTRGTVKQYSDLGLPIGWSKENATLDPWALTCTSKNGVVRVIEKPEDCKTGDETLGKVGWWTAFKLFCSLVLGGLLIGLGGPFWYDAVTGLTNIRSIAKDISGDQKPTAAAPTAPAAPAPAAVPGPAAGTAQAPRTPDRPQPGTPVGAFNISNAAR
ncbi:MAG: hypothetical protein WDO17_22150 [Alphaproteobacteria bacterium]